MILNTHGIWSSTSGGGGGPWTPILLPNLQVWTRGSELFTASEWGDKSGNNNDLIIDGAIPSVNFAVLNTEDTLNILSPPIFRLTTPTLSDPTIWMVLKPNALTQWFADLDGNDLQYAGSTLPNGTSRMLGATFGAFVQPGTLPDYRLVRYTTGGGANAAIEWGDQGETVTPFTINASDGIFNSNNITGDIAEIVIVNGTPNAGDIQNMKDYIYARYAIAM